MTIHYKSTAFDTIGHHSVNRMLNDTVQKTEENISTPEPLYYNTLKNITGNLKQILHTSC